MKVFLKFIGSGVAITLLLTLIVMTQCVNNPWPKSLQQGNIYFTNLAGDIKTQDPATSFYSHEADIMDLTYESLLTYHFLKRPYELMPALAEKIPEAIYYDTDGNVLPGDPDSNLVKRVEYIIQLKKNIPYQPHPCFVKNTDGSYKYRHLKAQDVAHISTPNELETATRFVTSHDFAVQLRRICDITTTSPIFSTFSSFIAGMNECSEAIKKEIEAQNIYQKKEFHRDINQYPVAIQYEKIPFKGIEIIDDHTFKIICTRKYPIILYWMAKSFFAPVPQEAIDFYAEPALIDKQIIFKNWPVVTGPYMMKSFEPQRRVIITKNPNHHHSFYPNKEDLSAEQIAQGLDKDCGKPLPFIDEIVFAQERESIPLWIKFIQGYYDNSGITADMFDQAIATTPGGDMGLSEEMEEQGISLSLNTDLGYFFFAFNMEDPVVGGYTPEKQKLRQAISIALDWNEFIDIFMNGRGIASQGVVPPEIYGHQGGKEGTNPYTDQWDTKLKKHIRQPIERAKQLLYEAGYPEGRDTNGKPLVIYFDHAATDKAIIAWLRKQFNKIGIDLQERVVDLNGFRDKVELGNWQTQLTGWLADYPDPENFLFLFYGPNGKRKYLGANTVNYSNPEFDRLFHRLENMNNGPERLELIHQANHILQKDAPVCWGYIRTNFVLTHRWVKNYYPIQIVKTGLKYRRIDWHDREATIIQWNKPNLCVVFIAMGIIWGIALIMFFIYTLNKRRNA